MNNISKIVDIQEYSEFLIHLVLNIAFLCGIFFTALRARGRLARKINIHASLTLIVYGVIALFILATRIYFSRPVLFGSFAFAMFGGIALIWLKHKVAGLRIAVLAPGRHSAGEWVQFGQLITDPEDDLRGFDLLLVTFQGALTSAWSESLARAALTGAEIRHVASYLEEARGEVSVEHFDVDHVSEGSLTSYRAGKRLMDIVLTVFVLPVALLLLLIGALIVVISMGRPIFFVQPRTGLGGRTFKMYKLRTMRAPRPEDGEIATNKNDVRITYFGALLRRFRIDELPQLWNILIGDMSLIGPRPEQPGLTKQYIDAMPAFAYRHLVRPGITGWAQVRAGYAANLEETRVKLAYDLFYVKNFSLILDLQIILRTFWTIVSGSGVR